MVSIKHWVGVCELAAQKQEKWGGVGLVWGWGGDGGWGVETVVELLSWIGCVVEPRYVALVTD